MSRKVCDKCGRPEVGCICHLFVQICNRVAICILQHPTEVTQTKGSVSLLANSLTNCQVLIGEDFSNNEELQEFLMRNEDSVALLYPDEKAIAINSSANVVKTGGKKISALILLDGTWKKAYKLYAKNPFLLKLPTVKLTDGYESLYATRKTGKAGALSTLEACCHALSCLEHNDIKYKPLLNSFKQFNDLLLSFKKG